MMRTALVLLALFNSQVLNAQIETLRHDIEGIISANKATIGISILPLTGGDILSINDDSHYPMQSVFKFHIALTVLHEVDKGNFTLDTPIFISESDMMKDTWSPLAKKYPEGNVSIPLSEIIFNTVSWSDNSGCDVLLKLLGGPKVVNDYIHSLGVKDVSIQVTEREMHADWNAQFKNWSTPSAATQLLKLFYEGKILSKGSHDFLWKTMVETATGKNRIPGLLPSGTIVAHKTGTSGQSPEGIMSAVNDIGIVTAPNGNHFAICVFVSDSHEDMTTNEEAIANVAKIAWDYFNK
jgi:beta-lactamase class A